MWTVAQFAARSGLNASALRFYDDEGLLPARRRANGYRVYGPDQLATARLVHSLRSAGVALGEIRAFLEMDDAARAEAIARWRREAALRRLHVELARRWLEGVEGDVPALHLEEWSEGAAIVWTPVEAKVGALPFASRVEGVRRALSARGFRCGHGGFMRTLRKRGDVLHGEIGVLVSNRPRLPDGARLEALEPTVFAALECRVDDERADHRVFRLLASFGFEPAGEALERYVGETDRYQLLVPLGITP